MSQTTLTAKPSLAVLEPPEPVVTKRKRILLVEGDGFTRLVLLLRLRLEGFAVDFTSNGILGLGKLRSCNPDILLVELKLCGMSGLDLIKAARAEPGFGNRPIYVFTHADRMSRAARKQLGPLATKIFDKNCVTREDLVQTFANLFLQRQAPGEANGVVDALMEPPPDTVPALGEIIAGVREQANTLAACADSQGRRSAGGELLSRVCSLASCAEAVKLPDLARQANALAEFLDQLAKSKPGYTDAGLNTMTPSVKVMSRIAADQTRKDHELSRFSAVVLDEAPASNRALKTALVKAGFIPIGFESAAPAREYLRANRTDVIIANVLLPEAHGLNQSSIRAFPLQAKTPVLFGPEPTLRKSRDIELPTCAAQFEREPLLLAELVLRALNEVQSRETAAPVNHQRALSAAAAGPTGNQANAVPGPAFEDSFALFAPPARAQESATPGVARAAQVVLPESQDPPLRWSISAEESATPEQTPPDNDLVPDTVIEADTAPDGSAEPQAQMPGQEPADGGQTEAPPAEVLPMAGFETATPSLGDTVSAAPAEGPELSSAALPADPIDQDFHASNSETPQDPTATTEPMSAVTSNQDEVMNDQIQAFAANPGMTEGQSDQYFTPAAPADPSVTEQNAVARCAELEQEVAALRQAFEGMNNNGYGQEHSDPEAQAEVQRQLQEMTTACQQQADACQHAQARCAELQEQMDGLRHTRDELSHKLAEEQKANAEAAARLKQLAEAPAAKPDAPASDLELQVRQGVAALAQATAELAQERGQRQRSEQRAAELSARLQALHQDLGRTLQAQQEDLARISALEEKERHTTQALEQRTADLEQQQAEHRLLDEQLKKASALNAQLQKDASFLEEANKRFETARLELQGRLEASLNATRESEARLQQEKAERQRLAEELDALQRKAGDSTERDLEFSKLQSAFQHEQVARKRQETQLAHVQFNAQDAAQAARALRTSLRRQVRQPVDNLVQSTRSLLELEMGEEQKKLAQAVLEDVLLVQTRLREPEPAAAEGDGQAKS